MTKGKTLADYIEFGTHELVAFVNGNKVNTASEGNLLGESNLGVLYIEKKFTDDEFYKKEDGVKFLYKKKSNYKPDSDIMIADFSLIRARVISEVPLGISTTYYNNFHLKKNSMEFREARKLLKKHGLY